MDKEVVREQKEVSAPLNMWYLYFIVTMHSTHKGYYDTNYSNDYLGMLLDTRMNLPRPCRFDKVTHFESTLLPTRGASSFLCLNNII